MSDDTRPDSPSLSRSLGWFGGSYLVSILAYLVVNGLSARILGAGSFGMFVVLCTIALVAAQLALLGTHRSGLREAARVTSATDPRLAMLRDDFRTIERTTLPSASVVLGIATGLLVHGSTSQRTAVAATLAVLVFAAAQQQLWSNALRGFGHIRFAGLMEGRSGGALVAVIQAVLLLGVYLAEPPTPLAFALAALGLGYLVPVVLARRLVVERWSDLPRSEIRLLPRLRLIGGRDWRFVLNAVTMSLSQNADIWLAGALMTALDSSLFSAAWRLALQLSLVVLATQVAFSPAISRLWHSGDHRNLTRLLRTGSTMGVVGLALALVPILVAPELIMRLLFGQQFADGAMMLVILSVGAASTGIGGLSSTALVMSGHEGVQAAAFGASFVVRCLLGVLLFTLMGPVGIAVGSAVVTVGMNVVIGLLLSRKLGLNGWPTLRPSLRVLRDTRA